MYYVRYSHVTDNFPLYTTLYYNTYHLYIQRMYHTLYQRSTGSGRYEAEDTYIRKNIILYYTLYSVRAYNERQAHGFLYRSFRKRYRVRNPRKLYSVIIYSLFIYVCSRFKLLSVTPQVEFYKIT